MTGARVVIAAVVVALGVSACSGEDPEPNVAPTSPTTSSEPSDPTTSPVSGPTAPTMPPEAMDRSDAGAAAFVEYWVRLVNFAQETGDVDELKAVNHRQCVGCRGLVKAINATYLDGGHIEGGTWSTGRLRELPLDFGAEWAGYAKASTAPQTLVNGDGTTTENAGGDFRLYTYVDWDDGWMMRWLRTPA